MLTTIVYFFQNHLKIFCQLNIYLIIIFLLVFNHKFSKKKNSLNLEIYFNYEIAKYLFSIIHILLQTFFYCEVKKITYLKYCEL